MASTQRMSAADYNAMLAKAGNSGGRVARGQKQRGKMNPFEAAYERDVLAPKLLAREILWYRFESIVLILAPKTTLTIDFFVMTAAGELEAHETKGFMEDDAAVKLKVARAMFPFRVKLIRAGKGSEYDVKEIG
jgi:hypothetical protein